MLRGGSFAVLLTVVGACLASCTQEEYPLPLYLAQHPARADGGSDGATSPVVEGGADGGSGANPPPPMPMDCPQARATPLPQRLVAISTSASTSSGETKLVSDVFDLFISSCGRCHGPGTSNGGFALASASDLRTGLTQDRLNHVFSNGPNDPSAPYPTDPMPPITDSAYAPYSSRPETDVIRQFAELAQAWINAGSPPSFMYTPPGAAMQSAGGDGGNPETIPALTPLYGDAMTNIGYCIPGAGLVGIDTTRMDALDAMFASSNANPAASAPEQVVGLPLHLKDTDLYTFDTKALAESGVIAYAPGYPLWSDNAGKIRYVRVPRGTSIQFDKKTQSFSIPPNTRFYKTFLKPIIDTDGSYRWRRIETRLIVARPDTADIEGVNAHNALFGTYLWNADESDAVLLTDPLRDSLPWSDHVMLYNTDEPLAADLLRGNPGDPEGTLIAAGAARHYAVPSSTRCIECHMGSATQSFSLGFLPLQINRRPLGIAGTIEPTGPDELTQLQRFISYGLITGIDQPSDILPLELSQGTRAPRNDAELVAQGYMLGNCSHCHNPRGNPSVLNPNLVSLLDFLPGPNSGIFQFPLERYSPRIFRDPAGSTQIPYITPSLMDLPRQDPTIPGTFDGNPFALNGHGESAEGFQGDIVYAPWRSLIYRNTDTAFSYTDDDALFPHMPRNVPGLDVRTRQILGEWMVSIPAVRKQPNLDEYSFCNSAGCNPDVPASWTDGPADMEEQPYVEVLPGQPQYAQAVAAADQRTQIFKGLAWPMPPSTPGQPYVRYTDPADTSDIIDPANAADPVCNPVPLPIQGIPPKHPHWVNSDLTQLQGYAPRRADWAAHLVEGQDDSAAHLATSCKVDDQGSQKALVDEAEAVDALQSVTFDQAFVDFATTPVPFGLWQKQPGCDYSQQKTVAQIAAADQAAGTPPPRWFNWLLPGQSTSDPVYFESPAASVFKMICINCHGQLADATGRLAANLADMTGGIDIVADFRDGLMGPVGAAPDATNRHAAFGTASLPNDASMAWKGLPAPDVQITPPLTADDVRAARYMSWMALGGTSRVIPEGVLQIVALTPVLGQRRLYLPQDGVSANMLSTAKAICNFFLDPHTLNSFTPVLKDLTQPFLPELDQYSTLVHSNGDAETWFKICSYNPNSSDPMFVAGNHPSPVRMLTIQSGGCGAIEKTDLNICESPVTPGQATLLDPTSYAASGALVGSADSSSPTTLQPDNYWPWCVTYFAADDIQAHDYVAAHNLPVCPTVCPSDNPKCPQSQGVSFWTLDDANKWAVRGAINAGLMVYLYVHQLEQVSSPQALPSLFPDYTDCPPPASSSVASSNTGH